MSFSALIPHAGQQYAGPARQSAFSCIADKAAKSIKYIIYIATMHSQSAPGLVLLHRDVSFPLDGDAPATRSYSGSEHSFAWVEAELRAKFPSAAILAIGPTSPGCKPAKDWIVSFCLLLQYRNQHNHQN